VEWVSRMSMYTHVATRARIQHRQTEFALYTQMHVDGLWEQVMILVEHFFLLYGALSVLIWAYMLATVRLGSLASELFEG
jgi:hypothetical protein